MYWKTLAYFGVHNLIHINYSSTSSDRLSRPARRNWFKSRPIWADWIPVVILVFIFACCPWNPISTILSFNKSSVSVSSIISWVLGAHSVKRNKCFVYLNQLKQLCVESLPSWITVYAFAITYICRVSLIINHELVWLSK